MDAIAYKDKIYVQTSDRRVEQIGNVLTNVDYEILLSGTSDDNYYIGETRKTASLTYNPSTNQLKINGTAVLTQHQDISGKADKATTLSGYGITDAKIANGVITLGNNTITPITSKTLNSTTLENTAGTFAFSGSGAPWAGSDWVGLQIGDANDKFQLTAQNNLLLFRQNDNGGTSTAWSNWITLTSSAKTNSSLTITAWQDTSHTGPISPTGLSGNISYYRRGNVCIVKINGIKVPAHSARMDLIPALPEGFRPPCELESNRGTFFLEGDGSVRMESNNSAQQIWDNLTYIAWE